MTCNLYQYFHSVSKSQANTIHVPEESKRMLSSQGIFYQWRKAISTPPSASTIIFQRTKRSSWGNFCKRGNFFFSNWQLIMTNDSLIHHPTHLSSTCLPLSMQSTFLICKQMLTSIFARVLNKLIFLLRIFSKVFQIFVHIQCLLVKFRV